MKPETAEKINALLKKTPMQERRKFIRFVASEGFTEKDIAKIYPGMGIEVIRSMMKPKQETSCGI